MTPKPKKVRKAVLPVAGLGTRFLPATKAIPKEMLTVVDKPLIQYAVEECIASGIEHVIFVTGRHKSAIEDHFDLAPELENFLEERGKSESARTVREIGGDLHFSYTRQSVAMGLGHAVLCAAELVGDEPFAVLLGDVIMDAPVPATRELIEICEATGGGGAIHVERVPRERLHFYGIIDAEKVGAPAGAEKSTWHDRLLHVKNLVEKPSADKAPSDLGITGRYVLPPEIFDYLAETKPGAGGEIPEAGASPAGVAQDARLDRDLSRGHAPGVRGGGREPRPGLGGGQPVTGPEAHGPGGRAGELDEPAARGGPVYVSLGADPV